MQTSSIFGSWELYKFFKESNITVVLDGQGADEFMGGYNRATYRKYLLDLLRNEGLRSTNSQVISISKEYGASKKKLFLSILKELFIQKSKTYPNQYYNYKLKHEKQWINSTFFKDYFKESHIIHKSFYKKDLDFNSILKKDSYELARHTNLPGILRQVDRNSMAFSVESRLPFLDYRLVELLYSLPINYMIREGYTKYAYRMAMKNSLPKEILWRKNKIGFKMPEYEILKNSKTYIKDVVMSLNEEDYINKDYFNRSLDFCLQNENSYSNMIWRILNFTIWKNQFNLK